MGTLYLVRHGQASFGAQNYDMLSPLGHQQSRRLGEYFNQKGIHFEAALTGTLNRQQQTFAGICEGLGVSFETRSATSPSMPVPSEGSAVREEATSVGAAPHQQGPWNRLSRATGAATPSGGGSVREQATSVDAAPHQQGPWNRLSRATGAAAPSGGSAVREATSVGAHTFWPGLNEYDGAALIAAIHPHPLAKPDTAELYKQYFRLLKDGLAQWMTGATSPRGMPSYPEFVAGITSALEHVRTHHEGHVLLVSSGGPIATAVGQLLGTRAEATIELNMGIRNSSVTEFSFNPKRYRLVTFNTLPHLDAQGYEHWATFA